KHAELQRESATSINSDPAILRTVDSRRTTDDCAAPPAPCHSWRPRPFGCGGAALWGREARGVPRARHEGAPGGRKPRDFRGGKEGVMTNKKRVGTPVDGARAATTNAGVAAESDEAELSALVRTTCAGDAAAWQALWLALAPVVDAAAGHFRVS